MKRFPMIALVAAMAFTLPACVSQTDYDNAVASTEKAMTEVDNANNLITDLQAELEAARAEKDEVLGQLETAQAETEDARAEAEDARAEAEDALAQLEGAKEELATTKASLEDVTAQLEQARKDADEQEAALALALDQVDGLKLDLDTLQASYDEYRHRQEGDSLVVSDELWATYEAMLQDKNSGVTRSAISDEDRQIKEEAMSAVSGLLIAPGTEKVIDSGSVLFVSEGEDVGPLTVSDELLEKYEGKLGGEEVPSEEEQAKKEEALESIDGLLVAPESLKPEE